MADDQADDFQPRVDDDSQHTALPPRLERWRKRSFTGALLTGIARGLQESLEPRVEEAAIVAQVPGEKEEEKPIDVHLEPNPDESVVVIRPWLLGTEE